MAEARVKADEEKAAAVQQEVEKAQASCQEEIAALKNDYDAALEELAKSKLKIEQLTKLAETEATAALDKQQALQQSLDKYCEQNEAANQLVARTKELNLNLQTKLGTKLADHRTYVENIDKELGNQRKMRD